MALRLAAPLHIAFEPDHPAPPDPPPAPRKGPRTPASSDAAREPAPGAVSCSDRLSRRRLPPPSG